MGGVASLPDGTTELVSASLGVGGTGLAVWLRERRLGRKDANMLALALIEAEAKRTTALTTEVARLSGRVDELSQRNHRLFAENLQLRADNEALAKLVEGADNVEAVVPRPDPPCI